MSELAHDLRDRIGPYQLIRAIGAGGSARIDLARIDRVYGFQRHIVIKRPLEHLRGNTNVALSLRREARIGGRLRHPNLVAVLDAGVHDGYDYLALEYVHGTSLRTLMQAETSGRVRAIPLGVALGIAADVCRALHAAHELADERGAPLGLVHRDVSPGNVLLGVDGSVKLADFGIAKETRVSTLSGSLHGTVTYMAPEQCRGHAYDRRADIFSIGVILYELATRRRLFWADNDVASLHRVLSGQVAPPRQVDPSISPALEQLVMTAIAHRPEQRFEHARQLADAIEGLAAAEGLVLGARWLARTLREELGAKRVPWIAAASAVHSALPEASLVDLIAATPEPDDEPVYPTFGPSHEHSLEEGDVPSAPLAPPARASATPSAHHWHPSRGFAIAIAALGAVTGVIATLALTRSGGTRAAELPPAPLLSPASPAKIAESAWIASPPRSPPPPARMAAPTPIAAVPTPIATPPQPTVEASARSPVAGLAPETVIESTPARPNSHKIARARQTSAPTAGSDENLPVTTPPAPDLPIASSSPPAGSASHPAWDRNLLLPSDTGSATHP